MKKLFICLSMLAITVSNAFATGGGGGVDLTGVTFNTDDPMALAAKVLVGLAVLWGIRKLIKLSNRS